MAKEKYDYSKLFGKITEKLGSRRQLAEKLGMNESTLSYKFNGTSDFSREEMKKTCIILNEPLSSIIEFFFNEKVREHEQEEED